MDDNTHLAAFWDLENIHIPKGSDARLMVQEIRSKVFPKAAFETFFKAYLDVSKISAETQRELERANVELVHVPTASKNGADLRIIQSINDFVRLQSDRNIVVVLLTSDENFLPLASSLRKIRGVQITLVHSKQTNVALIDAFDRAYLWPGLVSSKSRPVSDKKEPAVASSKEKDKKDVALKGTKSEVGEREKKNTSSAGSKGPRIERGEHDKRSEVPRSDSKVTKGESFESDRRTGSKQESGDRDNKKEALAGAKSDRRQDAKATKSYSDDKDKQGSSRATKPDSSIRALIEGTTRLDLQDRKLPPGSKRPSGPSVPSVGPAAEKGRARQIEGGRLKPTSRKSTEKSSESAKEQHSDLFECAECQRDFTSEKGLEQHQASTGHTNGFVCGECDKVFASEQALEMHQAATGHTDEFVCGECDKAFASEQALEMHQAATGHTDEFVCGECDKAFASEQALEMHQAATGHTDGFLCGECEKAFASEQALVMHQQSTGHSDGVCCGECDKVFKTQQALDSHQAATGHSDPVACPGCSRAFASGEALLQHQIATGHALSSFSVLNPAIYTGVQTALRGLISGSG